MNKRFYYFTIFLILAVAVFFVRNYIVTPSMNGADSEISVSPANIQSNIVKEVTVKKGDTLGRILRDQNLPSKDITFLTKLFHTEKIATQLKIGQVFSFNYDIEIIETPDSDLNAEQLSLNRMVLKINPTKSIEFIRKNDKFVVHHISSPLKKLIVQYETTIESNFTSSLKKAGMNNNSIVKLTNAYSHQVDFQRQIKSGDKITVLIEKFVTENDEFSHHGDILYSSLKSNSNEYNIYSYSPTGRASDRQFFTERGSSIKSTLLRTPMDVVRISSHFGYRKHPVLGYSVMHKGVDFAAAVGTPIYAAGDGVIEFAGWKGAYGRFVLLKHNKTLSTAYAHASKFRKGLKPGAKIKQGEIIAYVGNSGRTTGPHLHYEVRINGKQVNPVKFKSTPGVKLTGDKLSKFNKHKEKVKSLRKRLLTEDSVPSKDITIF